MSRESEYESGAGSRSISRELGVGESVYESGVGIGVGVRSRTMSREYETCVGSQESGFGSQEFVVRSLELGAGSQSISQELGVGSRSMSQESGVGSMRLESGVWSRDSGVRGLSSGVWIREPGVGVLVGSWESGVGV